MSIKEDEPLVRIKENDKKAFIPNNTYITLYFESVGKTQFYIITQEIITKKVYSESEVWITKNTLKEFCKKTLEYLENENNTRNI